MTPWQAIPFGLSLAAGVLCFRQQISGGDLRRYLVKQEIQQAARAMRQALRISNEESEMMRGILADAGLLLADAPLTIAKKKRFLARDTAALTRSLLDAIDAAGFHGQRIGMLRDELSDLAAGDCAPPPLIDGDDLIAAGLKPGPLFAKILEGVYDGQLEGVVRTKDQALAMAMDMAGTALRKGL